MKTPPPTDPEDPNAVERARGGGEHINPQQQQQQQLNSPLITPGSGGTGAVMARARYLGPEENLRVLADSWRTADPMGEEIGAGAASGTTLSDAEHASPDSIPEGEFNDLRSVIWTRLVMRLQNGDPKAMEELYSMFSNGVRFYLCRQLGPEELEDRLHDAYLTVVHAIKQGELRDPRRLMGFIRTVVKRMVAATIDKQVAARRERLDEEKTSNISDKRVTPEGAMLFQQQAQIVREVLQELNDRDRQVLTRFYVDEQSPQQICEEMSLTMTQFRLLKSRAKNRFGELGKKKIQKSGLSQIFLRFSGS